MEKQSMHRILGILVIIGFIIILLPLFQGVKEAAPETTQIEAPKFPEQVPEVSNNSNNTEIVQPNSVPQENQNSVPLMKIEEIKKEKVAVIKTNVLPIKNLAMHSSVSVQPKNNKTEAAKNIKSAAKVVTNKTINTIALNKDAWVIQIGSFKNKTNAMRIVNQLRANGYRAFIRQATTVLGEHTRVFVGPEAQRKTASAVADRIHRELHLPAIVTFYKPLAL